jgi:radical SAM protein with 4Fe4S-binding SPASM domain
MDHGYAVEKSIYQHSLWSETKQLLDSLDIELTERCNNACIHCYINLPERDARAQARELSTAEWQDILNQAAGLGALSVRMTGGEPLIREDFAELYLFARKLGMKVLLFTNARLITPELADLFARVPPLEKIEITVYGMRPESYDAVACAPGAYQEFRRGVSLLLQRGVPFVVKGALLPQNKDEIEEFEAWAATIPWMDKPPSYSKFFDLRGRRDSPARNRLIRSLRLSPEEGLEVITRRSDDYFDEMSQFCQRFMGPAGDRLLTCGAGLGGCVDAYGFLQPCMLLRAPDLVYDLSSGSLKDALENFFPGVREIKASNPAYMERCAICFLHGLCEQCPAKSWSEHGTLDTPVEYLCQIAHAQAYQLGLLEPGERAWEIQDGKERLNHMVSTVEK